MKYVINCCYGGFGLSEEARKALGINYDEGVDRSNPQLVAMVEENSKAVSGDYAYLTIVEIPDNATDWELLEYDGFEEIIAVVDGKIVHIN